MVRAQAQAFSPGAHAPANTVGDFGNVRDFGNGTVGDFGSVADFGN